MIAVADRLAIEDRIVAYADAVDRIVDVAAVVACFAPDGVLDLSCVGAAPIAGHDALRAFFTGSFAGAAHHAHHVSNFAFDACSDDTAALRCYVLGRALGKDGSSLTIHGRYRLDMVRVDDDWLIARLAMDLLLPLG